MKNLICLLFVFVSFFGCKVKYRNNTIKTNNNREVLIKTQDFEIHGHMFDELLHDTLKYFRKDTLHLIQVWDNGILKSNSINDNGRMRRLEYVNKQIDSVSRSVYYRDIADSSFATFPFDCNIFKFYDSIKVLTDTIFRENESTVFRILNVPLNSIAVGVVGGKANIANEKFIITPTRKSGETLKIQLWYEGLYESDFKNYTIKK